MIQPIFFTINGKSDNSEILKNATTKKIIIIGVIIMAAIHLLAQVFTSAFRIHNDTAIHKAKINSCIIPILNGPI
jgi:hypothetical protein